MFLFKKKLCIKQYPFHYSDYARLMKKYGSHSVLVFNVLTDSVEKSVNRLVNRLASGLKIDYVELGNENYAKAQGGYRLKNSDPNIYIQFSKQLSDALKKKYPSNSPCRKV